MNEQHPIENKIVDGICASAKLGWNVVKLVGPIAGRIAAKVAIRGGKAAASTPAAQKAAEVTKLLLAYQASEFDRTVRWVVKIFAISTFISIILVIFPPWDWQSSSKDALAPSSASAPLQGIRDDTTHIAPIAESGESSPATPEPTPTLHQPTATASPPTIGSLSAQRRAIQMYPQVSVANSPLNLEFLRRYRLYQTDNPSYFNDPEWPTTLAKESKDALIHKQR